jgi:hypothetical protein
MRLLVLLLFCGVATLAQDLQKGVVIPAIQLENSQEKSYALYLPNSYDVSQTYPVVFVFDDSGKGAAAVQRFTIGASLTESIVVGPNYALSDSLNVSLKQSAVLINAIFNAYAVDQNKVILSGEGRGGLIASTSAHLSQDVYGVIAINDVFIDENLLKKSPKARFVILNNDVGENYFKLKAIDNRFSFREKLLGYYEYSSSDTWPDAGYLSAALVDLVMPMADQAQVESFYASDLAFGELLYRKRKHLEAFTFLTDLKKQYKKQIDLKDQKELLREVRANTTFKVKRIQRNEVSFDEQLLLQDFTYFIQEDIEKAYFDNLGWWNYQMEALDTKIDSTAANGQERKSALRLKSYVKGKVEENYDLYSQNNASFEQLLFLNILRTLIQPDNQEAFLNVISLSAKEGDTNAALFYLEELLRTGYSDYESLYTIEGTTAVKITEEWNQVIKAYLGKSKFYNN